MPSRVNVATDLVIALQDKGVSKIDAIDTVIHKTKDLTDDEKRELVKKVNQYQ